MWNLITESGLLVTTGLILLYMWWMTRKEGLGQQGGLRYTTTGALAFLLGVGIDVSDNFASLDRYVILGGTTSGLYIMRTMYLVGCMLVLMGTLRWLPLTTALRRAEQNLQRYNEEMQQEILQPVQVEDQLRESEGQYRAVVENVADAIAINVGTRRAFVNKAFLALHGLTDVSQAQGLPLDYFVVPEDSELVKARTLARQRGEPVPEVYEYRIRRLDGDGEVRTVQTSAVPITYRGGPAALAVLQDVTDRKRAEQLLRRANAQLEEANRTLEDRVSQRTEELESANQQLMDAQDHLIRSEKLAAIGQLSGSVAHDLRNPLGAIKNALYYLDRKLKGTDLVLSNPRIGQFLQIMEDEIEHSNQIITDLMSFARVRAPSREPINLHEVADTALSRVEPAENVSIVKRYGIELPCVMADGAQLERVFMNLAKNAQDAMAGGAQLERVFMNLAKNAQDAMAGGGELTVSSRSTNDYVKVAFCDQGVGIAREDMGKIFDPLFTTKTKGTGLGLAICHEIVSKHGGVIDVNSESGMGATFAVRLPVNGHSP